MNQLLIPILIVFVIGFFFGRRTSDKIWKEAFEKWTNSIFEGYKKKIKELKDEIKKLKEENNS